MNTRLFTLALGGLCGLAALAFSPSTTAQGLEYTAIDGCRVLDTRKWNGTTSSTIPGGRAVEFHLSNEFGTIANQGGDSAGCPPIPDDAAAFAVTISPVAPAFPGSYPGVGFATLLPWDFGTWGITGATPAGNLIYSYSTPPFRESATVLWDSNTGMIANTTIVRACEGCSYHAKLYTSAVSHFVVDVVGIFTEISAVQNLTDAGLLGNLAGDIAQNNSTRQVSLNADLLDGFHASSFASAAHYHDTSHITSGTLSTARYSAYSDLSAEGYLANAAGDIARNNGALQVTLNADLLDGMDSAGFVSVFGGIVEGDLTMTYAAGHKFLDTSRGIGELNLYEDDSLNPGCRTVELDGDYGGYLYLRDDDCVGTNQFGTAQVEIQGSGSGGQMYLYDAAGTYRVFLDGDSGGGGLIQLRDASGATTIQLDADYSGDGRIITQELQITGGSDLSENFDLAPTDLPVEPGMILSIDPQRPGQLALSTEPYDHKVAGIISGADGVKPGLIMGQEGTIADGAYPVAITGRVYCLADASEHAIEPGDLLTTSAVPGHAMKVTDHTRAWGAIIGKAMTALDSGQGKVLVLVSLR